MNMITKSIEIIIQRDLGHYPEEERNPTLWLKAYGENPEFDKTKYELLFLLELDAELTGLGSV